MTIIRLCSAPAGGVTAGPKKTSGSINVIAGVRIHGEAKTWHGLASAIRRGLANMKIQAYLTAAAINLKRLAAAILVFLYACTAYQRAKRNSHEPSLAQNRNWRWR